MRLSQLLFKHHALDASCQFHLRLLADSRHRQVNYQFETFWQFELRNAVSAHYFHSTKTHF